MVKSFLLKTFLPVFAFVADIVSIYSAINSENNTITKMIENPYIKVLFYTLSLTALVFLIKYFFTRFSKKKPDLPIDEKSKMELYTFLFLGMIILCGIILILAFSKPKLGQPSQTFRDTIFQTKVIHDTIKMPVFLNMPPNKAITILRSKKDTSSKKAGVEQNNSQGDNQANVNNGTNNGIIGNNATVNTPIQPHPDMKMVVSIESAIPNKNTLVEFYYPNNSKFSHVFANDLIEKLKADGYTNLNSIIDLAPSIKPIAVSLMKSDKPNTVSFYVQVD